MERVHYRRVAQQGAYERGNTARDGGGSREWLIMQGIVSGMILAAALLLRMVDTDLTYRVRANLNQALSNQVSVENIVAELQQFGRDALGQSLTDELPAAEAGEPPVVVPVMENNAAAQEAVAGQTEQQAEGFYIDEDVLAELNALTAYTDNGEASKSPVPEPSASPGP